MPKSRFFHLDFCRGFALDILLTLREMFLRKLCHSQAQADRWLRWEAPCCATFELGAVWCGVLWCGRRCSGAARQLAALAAVFTVAHGAARDTFRRFSPPFWPPAGLRHTRDAAPMVRPRGVWGAAGKPGATGGAGRKQATAAGRPGRTHVCGPVLPRGRRPRPRGARRGGGGDPGPGRGV